MKIIGENIDMELRDEIANIIFETDHEWLSSMECCTELAINILEYIEKRNRESE